MLRLTYISTATSRISDADVNAILGASRRNNGAAGLTGLLLYDGRRFLQALEGEEGAVKRAFERIKADPRHRAVVVLSSRTVNARAFGDWAMAAERVATAEAGTSVAAQVDALTAHISEPIVRDEFRSFAAVRGAA